MARTNDTVAQGAANKTEQFDETERTERTDQPGPARYDRRSSILLNVDEEEEDREVTLEEFKQFVTEKPEWLYTRLQDMHLRFNNSMEERESHVDEAHFRSKAMEGEIALLQRKMAEVKMERDAFGRQLAQYVMMCSNQHQQTATAPASHKTSKIHDPSMLTDGKEPRFDDWLLLMSQKLAANADHFNTSQLCIAYVASQYEGKSRKHITLQMRDNAMSPYTDSKDMFDHLKMIYSNLNRVTTAKNQFRQLYMKTSDKFHDFLSEFLFLAAEAGVAEDDWKDELYYKLTTELQKLCISDSIKDSDFQEFSSAVSQTANRLEVINHRTQKNRAFAASRDPAKNPGRTDNPIKKESSPPRSSVSSNPRVNRNKLMRKGKCFHCQVYGHLAQDCTAKSATSELKELEQGWI